MLLNSIETAWRDLKRRLAGRHFWSADELKCAITTIVECEMGNRLKGSCKKPCLSRGVIQLKACRPAYWNKNTKRTRRQSECSWK